MIKITENTITDLDALKSRVLSGTLSFTRYMFKGMYKRKFLINSHHVTITDVLDRVLRGELTRVIFNVAPRYSKTEIAVKNFISMGLAINPASKFIHLSYSDDLARDNSSAVQDIIRHESYRKLFDVSLTSEGTKMWSTTSGGGLYAVSSAGQVTGFGAGMVDDEEGNKNADDELTNEILSLESYISEMEKFAGAIIIDDPIKPDDALSQKMREKVNNKFETTIRNRVNSRKTPIIIIMQRLHEEDLCGYLLNLEPDVWTVVSLPCIYQDENGNDTALWPVKHTLEELYDLKDKSPFVFETQYMQNPKPREGLMYENPFKEYYTIPETQKKVIKSYTDTADTGEDYLCSIVYVETEIGNFVLDVLYTQRAMEYTEPETAKMFSKHKVQSAAIESNNGGRGFARAVENQCRIMGNGKTHFNWFHQSLNKDVRIFSHSSEVNNMTWFPSGWHKMWPEFFRHVTNYTKTGKNKHDDAPDTLTGMIEQRKTQPIDKQRLSRLAY